MRTTVLSSIAAVAALALALAGGARPGSASVAVVHDTTVAVKGFGFRPPALYVRAGSRVTWVNQDDIEHTVTSGNPERRDERFASALSRKGATYSVTFAAAGSYTYYCDRHPFMRGEIHVTTQETGQ